MKLVCPVCGSRGRKFPDVESLLVHAVDYAGQGAVNGDLHNHLYALLMHFKKLTKSAPPLP